MTLLRGLFEPATQRQFISDIAQQIAETGVDGVNIDFEPLLNVHDARDPTAPTIEDGLA